MTITELIEQLQAHLEDGVDPEESVVLELAYDGNHNFEIDGVRVSSGGYIALTAKDI